VTTPEQHRRDQHFMHLAIDQAKLGIRTPGGAEVGCILVKHGTVAASGFNEAALHSDPTAHAEIVTIRRLCAERKTLSLAGCTLYCTLQPCAMCTAASLWSGISRIVYGAGRADVHPLYFAERLQNTEDLIADAYRNDIEMVSGILRDECAQFYLTPRDPAPPDPDPAHDPTVQP
jgi:tRNA(adenine34) deaminase